VVANRRHNSILSSYPTSGHVTQAHADSYTTRKKGFVLRRIYDVDRDDDDYRVLVDRFWPRGISKATAALETC
jgi:hypothetical protein